MTRFSSYSPLWRSKDSVTRNVAETLVDTLEIQQAVGCHATFAPSQFVARWVSELEALSVDVIRSPLPQPPSQPDPSVFNSRLRGLSYLVYFGQISAHKGVDLLARAMPPLLMRDKDLHLVLVGRDRGFRSGGSIVEAVLSACGAASDRVVHLPPLPRSQLFPVLERAIAALIPSRVDNYPNACLEAQLAGLPVVASNRSSLEEMVDEGLTGFLFENGSAESLRSALDRLFALSSDGLHGLRSRVVDHASILSRENRIGELERFYDSVTSGEIDNRGRRFRVGMIR